MHINFQLLPKTFGRGQCSGGGFSPVRINATVVVDGRYILTTLPTGQ